MPGKQAILQMMFGGGSPAGLGGVNASIEDLERERAALAEAGEPEPTRLGVKGALTGAGAAIGDSLLTYASILAGGGPQSNFINRFVDQKMQERATAKEDELRERGEKIRQLDERIDRAASESERLAAEGHDAFMLKEEDRLAREREAIRSKSSIAMAEVEHLRTLGQYGASIGATGIGQASSPQEALEMIAAAENRRWQDKIAADADGRNAATTRFNAENAMGISGQITAQWQGQVDEFGQYHPGQMAVELKAADDPFEIYARELDDITAEMAQAENAQFIGKGDSNDLVAQFTRQALPQLKDIVAERLAASDAGPAVRSQIVEAMHVGDWGLASMLLRGFSGEGNKQPKKDKRDDEPGATAGARATKAGEEVRRRGFAQPGMK